MSEIIKLEVTLRAFVRKETKNRWSALCPMLGVASQGQSEPDAKRALREAVELWFESCLERGVLDQALREANFRPMAYDQIPPPGADHVLFSRSFDDDTGLLGQDFAIQLSIPAYQASAFLSAAQ